MDVFSNFSQNLRTGRLDRKTFQIHNFKENLQDIPDQT